MSPVVLLHSGGMSSRQWRALEGALAGRWPVVAPDLLGSGSSTPFIDATPYAMQMDVDALLPAIRRVAPAHLVGHSFGGLLALKIALQEPRLVRSLALYEPPAFGVLRGFPEEAAHAELAALARVPVFTDEELGGTEPWMRVFVDYWNGPGAWDQLPSGSRAAFLRTGRKVFREVLAITADGTTAADVARLGVPVLLMAGGTSPLAERRVMARLAEALPHASVVTFEDAGHMGPLTHASQVSAAIVRHLESVER